MPDMKPSGRSGPRARQLLLHLAAERPPAPFQKVLIANRGEIALRIAQAAGVSATTAAAAVTPFAATLDIRTTAVFAPPADEHALHRQYCDEAVALARSGIEGYLDGDGLVATAVRAGCDCVHPGYGFLSESAHFARK